ncbi:MAG: phosphoribosylformimino-5-aminoimidazole carboxamide ribotide isomerase [Eubacterium sp.]|nr:phosphoribosylformimino-5-aminoimidazole carboxamide ribotide isomerase [Eubacterium sp.]
MRFRPCIDIHNGCVKQIVGGTLSDREGASTNFVAGEGGDFYGSLYRRLGLRGGHIILLNPAGTPEYEADLRVAKDALAAFPDGLMIGGGVTAENAPELLSCGATHVIVTSYVFRDGGMDRGRMDALLSAVGREHITLDLSCRKTENGYRIATDRWQKLTDIPVNREQLFRFSEEADEFLIHAVDVEGRRQGIDEELAELLGEWAEESSFPVTYAGGVGSFSDLESLSRAGRNRLDVTIGSALDIFGGDMKLEEVLAYLSGTEV